MVFRNFIILPLKPLVYSGLWLSLILLPAAAFSAETYGVFIVNSRANLYSSADRAGRVNYTTRKTPFKVVQIAEEGKVLMLKIEFPFRTQTASYSGFVVYSPVNLPNDAAPADSTKDSTAAGPTDTSSDLEPDQKKNDPSMVNVFAEIPTAKDRYPGLDPVAVSDIQYTGVTGESQLYENTKWYEVTYSKVVPMTFWVNAGQGLFREFGSPEIAQNLLNASGRYTAEKFEALILGDIKKGFTTEDVLLALGKPVSEVSVNNAQEVWTYPLLSVEIDKNRRVVNVNYYKAN